MPTMRIVTGTVVDGKVEVPPEIEEGANVAVLAPDGEPFVLTVEQEQELSDSIRQIENGESVDGWKLLDEIKAKTVG